jgi:N-acetylmuramoyl-L-alanine amidase
MLVVLDAGHGGKDPGAQYDNLNEKNIVLTITKLVRDHLTRNFKVDVVLTRTTDEFVSLRRRAEIANQRGADLFVSIHVNAGGGTGFESYIYSGTTNPRTPQYQDILHEHITDLLRKYNVNNRGQKKANFAVLRETTMPAVLLELLFIDSPQDRQLLTSDTFLKNVAAAISIGIADVLDLPEKSRVSSSSGGQATPIPTGGTGGTSGEIYRVQVGAFDSFDNAEALSDELERKGFEAFIYEEEDLFIVQAGAFKDLDNAEQLGARLKEAGFEVYIHS